LAGRRLPRAGEVRPGHDPPAPARRAAPQVRRRGYLVEANTLRGLAAAIDVDPDGLEQTVAATNRYPRTGVDEEFGKGESAFGRQYGDPAHRPNVDLGPIDRPPYYAVAVVPTPLGTALGLRTTPEPR
jgi:hypothetical protein